MTYEESEGIISSVAANVARWGKQYSAKDVGIRPLMEAIQVYHTASEEELVRLRADLKEVNGKYSAARAREVRAKKIKESKA